MVAGPEDTACAAVEFLGDGVGLAGTLLDNLVHDPGGVAVDMMAGVCQVDYRHPVDAGDLDWLVIGSDSAAVGQRVDGDDHGDRCTEYRDSAVPGIRGSEDGVRPCAAAGPFAPSADKSADLGKAPGTMGAADPGPAGADQLRLLPATGRLCPGLAGVSSALKLLGVC